MSLYEIRNNLIFAHWWLTFFEQWWHLHFTFGLPCDRTHSFARTDIANMWEVLLYLASAFLLLKRLALLDGYQRTLERHHRYTLNAPLSLRHGEQLRLHNEHAFSASIPVIAHRFAPTWSEQAHLDPFVVVRLRLQKKHDLLLVCTTKCPGASIFFRTYM